MSFTHFRKAVDIPMGDDGNFGRLIQILHEKGILTDTDVKSINTRPCRQNKAVIDLLKRLDEQEKK